MPLRAEPIQQHFYLKRGQALPTQFKFPSAPGSLVGLAFKFGLKRTRGLELPYVPADVAAYLFLLDLTVTDTNPDANEVMATAATTASTWTLVAGLYYFTVWCVTSGFEGVYACGTITIEET